MVLSLRRSWRDDSNDGSLCRHDFCRRRRMTSTSYPRPSLGFWVWGPGMMIHVTPNKQLLNGPAENLDAWAKKKRRRKGGGGREVYVL